MTPPDQRTPESLFSSRGYPARIKGYDNSLRIVGVVHATLGAAERIAWYA